MGKFWEGVTHHNIDKIYEAALSALGILLEVCEIDENDSQETKCATWFSKYIRYCTPECFNYCYGSVLVLFSCYQTQKLKSLGILMSVKCW